MITLLINVLFAWKFSPNGAKIRFTHAIFVDFVWKNINGCVKSAYHKYPFLTSCDNSGHNRPIVCPNRNQPVFGISVSASRRFGKG